MKNPVLSMLTLPLDVGVRSVKADVLVVLGAAMTPDGRLGPALDERVRVGVDAWHRGVAPKILMTGKYEATAMRARALELGVAESAILLEHTALSTRENALFSSELMRVHGLARALIVTQPFHRLRAIAAFRKLGIDAQALAFPSERVTPRQVFREYGALAVYGLRGWLY
jgi:uncharacterized SAM-binding protein YcdF (DUF218 family)